MFKKHPLTQRLVSEDDQQQPSQDPNVEAYASFLEDEVPHIIEQSSRKNAEALKIVNQNFVDLVRANPALVNEYAMRKGKQLSEMSKSEAYNIFGAYATLLDKKVRPALSRAKGGDSGIIKKLHDVVLDIVNNIREYSNLLSAIALDLSNVSYYPEEIA